MTRPWIRTAAFVGAVLVVTLTPFRGWAQERRGAPTKTIRLDEIVVEGKIQKPQAFYILQRSNLNFDELNRLESFLPKVVKSVEKEIF